MLYKVIISFPCSQVLSGKLMPTQEEDGMRSETRQFCEEFLTNGGLSLVVNVLQPEALPNDINYEIRQGCYSICLQLARYILSQFYFFLVCSCISTYSTTKFNQL